MQNCEELWARLDRLLDRTFGELDVHWPIPAVLDRPASVGPILFELFALPLDGLVWAGVKFLWRILMEVLAG